MNAQNFVQDIVRFSQTNLELKWLDGRNPGCDWDGGHYALPGTPRPLSVSKVEARFLANFVVLQEALTVLEIGTAFGYSTSWLAFGVSNVGTGGLVLTIDDYSEGAKPALTRDTAIALWDATGASDFIEMRHGRSPEIFSHQSFPEIDLAFIDGEHRNQQPLADYNKIQPLLSPDGVLVFHDAQSKYDVESAVSAAISDGYKILRLGTSCEAAVGLRKGRQVYNAETALRLARNGLLIGRG